MEETIYQQVWIQVYALTFARMHEQSIAEQEYDATFEADAAAKTAVKNFDHAKMQAAIDAKREATDAAMEGK